MARVRPRLKPDDGTATHQDRTGADNVNAVVRPFLIAIAELQQLSQERRPPGEIAHKEVRRFLDDTVSKAAAVGLSQEDQQDLRFALVAFADEMMQLTPGRFQEFWSSHLLQEVYFDSSLAGEVFYERIAPIRADRRRHNVLLVYYLCMLFGYRGKYRGGSELAIENLLDDVRNDLQQSIGLNNPVELAPAGDRPDELAVDSRRNLLLQGLAVTVAVLSVLLYIGLWLVIDGDTQEVLDTLQGQQKELAN